ncbi:site-specific integrase [Anaerococcus sp. WCA-380-WT-2B]|uniref:Site-specific integrase n=1 Tax=Anaerococcus porci TaxID=2652269 RepID=A0A6N7VEW1_9FIRM|nr:site-specific integrase [Anaerococcus porci]MSS77421.1 site-specific integrase [Anaerococcus porci]
MKITSYKDREGQTLYKFNIYLGKDPLTGKEIRTNRQGFTSKKQAQIEYARLKKRGIKSISTHTINDIYKQWLPLYETTVKYTSLTRVKGIFKNHILPYLGNKKIDKITTPTVQKLINQKSKILVDFKLVNMYLNILYKFAINQGYTDFNPCTNIIYPTNNTKPKKEEIEYWTKDELKEFLEKAKIELTTMWYLFFRISTYTGLRKGEILALTWKDIDFKNKTLTVNKNLSKTKESKKAITSPKTKSSYRTISIDKDTLNNLKQWHTEQSETGIVNIKQYIFTTQSGDLINLNSPRKRFEKVIKKYKLRKIKLHSLRHTHASLCFEAGMTIKDVQHRLGHSTANTTMNIYVHVTKSQEEKSAEKFQKFMLT